VTFEVLTFGSEKRAQVPQVRDAETCFKSFGQRWVDSGGWGARARRRCIMRQERCNRVISVLFLGAVARLVQRAAGVVCISATASAARRLCGGGGERPGEQRAHCGGGRVGCGASSKCVYEVWACVLMLRADPVTAIKGGAAHDRN
jgi:hypothetical protein